MEVVVLNHQNVLCYKELLSMIYERNAWWKMKQQEGESETVPVAVDGVTLIPNRIDGGMLVSYLE